MTVESTPPVAVDGAVEARPERRFWELWRPKITPEDKHRADLPGPEHLATARRALNLDPGGVPGLWRWYTTLDDRGRLTTKLRAEHAALGLYGVHQQGNAARMHDPSVRIGEALHNLRRAGKYSEVALDRRVTAAATANDLPELVHHLRGLIAMLRGLGQPLDYNALYRDLCAWQDPSAQAAVRRRWGAAYFAVTTSNNTENSGKDPR
ncbi:MAG: type I-E CRISPR-associated protein Cse2/CasB [Phycicoccus sp.]|nr:type I-E CRISPR-associated protein Cse2/CasB [Phycicoccus sp.]